ncbi:hypothetical protein OpiT1DRAFT_02759 [Opitutaceae bacterium TAV1]|nr:hypothetical protein OPIT5_12475 [Opitutaceae bacterium TAV5]EIP98304.1 hypothetical protein OpiT1DRAFT_02759 [Opitutaceae bacterium TAV1]
MDTPLLSFESLRAYPHWLVLVCVGVLVGGLLIALAKPLKWGLYALLAGLFLAALGAVAAWLAA